MLKKHFNILHPFTFIHKMFHALFHLLRSVFTTPHENTRQSMGWSEDKRQLHIKYIKKRDRWIILFNFAG